MAKTKKVLTYDVSEVCDMLGMEKTTALAMIKKNKFPFPVIQVGDKRWVVPRASVDKALKEGKTTDRTEEYIKHTSPLKKWYKGEYTNWNFQVPNDLAEAFKIVADEENKQLATPMNYNDFRRLAIVEFIERRPIGGDG